MNDGRYMATQWDGKEINILDTKGRHLQKKYLLVCFFDNNNQQWFYKSFLADDLAKKIMYHQLFNSIKEVKEGIEIRSSNSENLTVLVNKDKLPMVEYIRIASYPKGGNAKLLAIYDMQNAVIKPTNYKIGSAGSGNDLDKFTSMVFLYDKDKNLVYYHQVTDEETYASRKFFKDAYIEFELVPLKDKVTASDFNVIRKGNGEIDSDYRYSGGSSSPTSEGGKLSSMIIGSFFFENDTAEYIIESKIDNLKIKSVTFK